MLPCGWIRRFESQPAAGFRRRRRAGDQRSVGASRARIESLEAGFIDVRQNVAADCGPVDLVIASVLGLGAVQVYMLDAPSLKVS